MKKYIILLLFVVMGFFFTSCSEGFLDNAPQSGLPENEVFSNYENFIKYFRGMDNDYRMGFPLTNPGGYAVSYYNWTWDMMTQLSASGKNIVETPERMKSGGYTSEAGGEAYPRMISAIRRCNMTLEKIDLLKDATQEDKDDLIAQAHFIRAFCHLHILKLYGGQPYITKVLGTDDPWDHVRLSPHETLLKIVADLDTAYSFYVKAGRVRRDDPVPGSPGNLTHPNMKYPNGVAAMALKGRALLYAASPLNNTLGETDWQNAAIANWEAIKIAQTWGYYLLPAADYKKNFNGAASTNEQIWSWPYGPLSMIYIKSIIPSFFNKGFADAAGENPTQNLVDMFETSWGEPLNTQADRDAAAALGHYNEQAPYANRDPRFYIDIIYNTAPLLGFGTAKIYYTMVGGVPQYSDILDRSQVDWSKTGYLNRKQWGDQSIQYNNVNVIYSDPVIRMAELYLNYAEAANEAYGPSGSAPGATMTAVQALNFVRTRVGQPGVLSQHTVNKDVFRERIKNERTIELIYEGQYYFDVRRWKDAPTAYSTVIMAMDIEKVSVSPAYPTGYKYSRVPLAANRQVKWKEQMYYFPTPVSEGYKMKLYIPNPQW